MAGIAQERVDEAITALNKVRRAWMRRPGVVALDVGFPIRNQVVHRDEVAVRVHVELKLSESALAPGEQFPETLDGVPVDVIEATYEATAAPQKAANGAAGGVDVGQRHQRGTPLMGGLSVGNPRISAGTLGAIVWDKRDGSPNILSNWHVLAGSVPVCGHGPAGAARPEPHYQSLVGIEPHYQSLAGIEPHYQSLTGIEPHYQAMAGIEPHYQSASAGAPHLQAAAVGEPIYQPARFDGGTAADTVAYLNRLRLDRHMDAAIARLNGARGYCAEILELSPCREAEEPQLGMRVHKSGRSTGKTEGVIDGVSLSTVIEYPHGRHSFDNQIHVIPPDPWPASGTDPQTSEPGDSGALWINMDSGKAVGLHFGGSVVGTEESEHSLASPITTVLEVLEISLTPVLLPLDRAPRPQRSASPGLGSLVQAILDLSGADGRRARGAGSGTRGADSSRAQLEALRAVIDTQLNRLA